MKNPFEKFEKERRKEYMKLVTRAARMLQNEMEDSEILKETSISSEDLDELRRLLQPLKEVERIQRGELPRKTARQLLAELNNEE